MAKLRTKKYSPHILPDKPASTNLKVPVAIKDPRRPIIHMETVFKGLGRIPKEDEERRKLLQEFIDWSFTTDSLEMEDFALSKRINPYRFHLLRNEDPVYEDIFELAKYSFASRLKKSARLDNKVFSDQYVMKYLPIYDREYREWVVSQVTKAIEERMKINVIMQEIPKTDKVPERKLDGE